MRLDFEVSYDEMASIVEGRTPHYILACGIFLVGAVSLTLIISIFIHIKKHRGPTSERPPLRTKRSSGMAFGDKSNHSNIHCGDMESQEKDNSVTFVDSIVFHS